MKGAEHQVTRLCCRDGRLDRLQVTHLTHQNDVRIHPQDAPQRLAEAGHVHVHLALGNYGGLVVVIKLNGIFNGDDVGVVALRVDDVNHRGQRGAFAGAGRPGDQAHATRLVQQFLHRRRQADLLECQQGCRYLPQHARKPAPLLEHAHPETRHFTKRKGKIRPTALPHLLDILVGRDGTHQLLGNLIRDNRAIHLLQNPVQADARRHAHPNVKIGCALLYHKVQQV